MRPQDTALLAIVAAVAVATFLIGVTVSGSLVEKPKLFDNSLPWMRINLTTILANSEKYGVTVNRGTSDVVVVLSYVDNYTITVSSGYRSAGSFKVNRSELMNMVRHIINLAKEYDVTLILLPRPSNETIEIVASLYCGNLIAYLNSTPSTDTRCIDKAKNANITAWNISEALAHAYAYEPIGVNQPINPPSIWLMAINVTGIRSNDPYLSYAPFTYPNPIRDDALNHWLKYVTNLFKSMKCIWTKNPWCWGTAPPESLG